MTITFFRKMYKRRQSIFEFIGIVSTVFVIINIWNTLKLKPRHPPLLHRNKREELSNISNPQYKLLNRHSASKYDNFHGIDYLNTC